MKHAWGWNEPSIESLAKLLHSIMASMSILWCHMAYSGPELTLPLSGVHAVGNSPHSRK